MPVQPAHTIELAPPRELVLHAARTVLLATVIPMALFYLALSLSGLNVAVATAAGWYYAALIIRVARKRPVMGVAFLGAGLMTVRAFVTFWTGSAFLFFLQPVAGTIATATALAITALAGRPLLERLMHDFVPLPGPLRQRLRAHRFFDYTALVWSAIYFLNAAGTVWLLTNASLGGFLVLKTLMSPVLTGIAIGATYALFRLLLRRDNIQIRWGRTGAEAEAAA
jgi:hypothetical protein